MTFKEEAETDQSIELAHELLRAWMEKEVLHMTEIGWIGRVGDFKTGWEAACEEMQARLEGASFAAFGAVREAP